MARITTSNYQADADTIFQYATLDGDFFDRELDLSFLARALDRHDHSSNRGLAVSRLAAGSVVTASFAAGAVDSAAIGASQVVTSKIADLNVTTGKLADLAVTTAKIADANVTTAKILDANVTTAKINDLAVISGKLAADAVTTAKILNENVTDAKLATGAVTTVKIADAQVTNGKLAGNITHDKMLSGLTGPLVFTNAVGRKLDLYSTSHGISIESGGSLGVMFGTGLTWGVADNAAGTNFRAFWHSGNDGPGSGLDADTVDGSHASAFAVVNASVPLSGMILFRSSGELSSAGSAWARETSHDGRLLLVSGSTFSQTFTDGNNYGSNWTPLSGTNTGSASETFPITGGGTQVASAGHTHQIPSTTWVPPARTVIVGRRVN